MAELTRVARSRTAAASQVERAQMLLAYRETPSFYAVGRAIGVTHQTVERCVRHAERLGHHGVARRQSAPRPRAGHLTGVVHASVEERHRSREFVAFLQKLDAAYPPATAIKLILDNHSAHVSKETKAWLAAQPQGRFTYSAFSTPQLAK